MTPRLKRTNKLKLLTDEVTILRARVVEQSLITIAKDKALKDFVEARIAKINEAIRQSNGPRRGEREQSYRKRIVEIAPNA